MVGIVLTAMSMLVICGGVHRISRFSEIVVPVMAIGYVVLVILAINITRVPEIFALIFRSAFTGEAAVGGGVGMAVMMG